MVQVGHWKEGGIQQFVGFNMDSMTGFGILDGGASKFIGGVDQMQDIVDEYHEAGYPDDIRLEEFDTGFVFVGGENNISHKPQLRGLDAAGRTPAIYNII